MSENIGMAQLTNLDRILQREERQAHGKIKQLELMIADLQTQTAEAQTSLQYQRDVYREVIEAMVARDVPVYQSERGVV